jgi:hypothetical protein
MRIIVEIADSQQVQALAHLHGLGYHAFIEAEKTLDEIEESHIQQILARRQDPTLSQTKSLEEVFAAYDTRRKLRS